MTERDRIAPERADLTGGGSRRDYGPKGCAGIVYAAAVVVVVMVLALVGCGPEKRFVPGTGEFSTPTAPAVPAPQPPAGE